MQDTKIDPHTVIVIGPHYWGKGATLDEAARNARAEGLRDNQQRIVFRFYEGCTFEGVDGYGAIHWDGDGSKYERSQMFANRRAMNAAS